MAPEYAADVTKVRKVAQCVSCLKRARVLSLNAGAGDGALPKVQQNDGAQSIRPRAFLQNPELWDFKRGLIVIHPPNKAESQSQMNMKMTRGSDATPGLVVLFSSG
ncbi:hypothetical protein E4191_10155 [Paracoccus liaowanqingii]|uniref:Uncharacterized protein n=1 Tax=Paracoccus liaowanqingii TaxID=2560053 RepID=A0A4P7HMS1_9RHOB|nr:hypothetical protein [Paracoccus liaowanqingii]QBX35030.1 hypothetical protein E4191_10155 [Paracoccus liaowanqingii]